MWWSCHCSAPHEGNDPLKKEYRILYGKEHRKIQVHESLAYSILNWECISEVIPVVHRNPHINPSPH